MSGGKRLALALSAPGEHDDLMLATDMVTAFLEGIFEHEADVDE